VSNVFSAGDLRKVKPVVDRATGVWIYDTNGKRYLDATGGAVVCGIGHAVPEVLDAMRAQAERVCYAYYNQFTNEAVEQLASELAAFCPGDLERVFFASGGSEATESAIKIARSYHRARGDEGRFKLIGRWRGYHGNTFGALSASGHVARREPYQPYLLPFRHISPPYCYRCFLGKEHPSCALACAMELERAILEEGPETISAFISEPVGGSAAPGMVPPPGYFELVRTICDKYGILFIADEVLCGVGRTGKNCAIEHWDVVPDMVIVAKGLSGGYTPLGAVVVRAPIYDTIEEEVGSFEHGFTFSGNPLSCATGLAVLRYIEDNDLVGAAAVKGDYLLAQVRERLGGLPIVGDIDGKGLLVGIELVASRESREPFPRAVQVSKRIVARAFESGVIVLGGSGGQADGVNGDRIEIAPPYVTGEAELDLLCDVLEAELVAVSLELQREAVAS
jgi:adenosylmethionine-8-amino-7-oxononanoate aminotransferase